MTEKTQIVYKKLKDIKPYEKNPRRNDEAVEYVMQSIDEFGFKVPIVIDKNNVIVAGHTRFKAAKKLNKSVVPCIVADDLTEEQVKAFRLADNKVAEKAEWDFDLLNEEITDIVDIDMELFGFDIPFFDEEEPEEDEKHNERERTDNAYNLDEFDEEHTEGYYQMPKIDACGFIPEDIIGFNYALTSTNKDCGIHYFSLYKEMPIAMKIWNIYRSRLIGQIAQRMGLLVIPTVSWCERATFDFCFDGLPKRSTLSISTIGVKKDDYNFSLWKAGVDEMIKRLEPKTLLIYGGKVDYDFGNIKTVYFENKVTERMKQCE